MFPSPSSSMSMAAPVPALSSRAARRDADRQRKRAERQALRDAGAPDPRQLDAAIVDALRDALVAPAGQGVVRRHADIHDVLRGAALALRGKAHGGVSLRREAIHQALADRLAPRQDLPGVHAFCLLARSRRHRRGAIMATERAAPSST